MGKVYDVAIVGGGIAGYTAALTAKHLLLDYIWLGESLFGGKLRAAETVTNFPAIAGVGADFVEALERQQTREGVHFTKARIDGIYASGGKFLLTSGAETFESRSAILATGLEVKGRLKGENEFLGRGVSYCAVCDGALYRGKRIAAVLSSAAFEEEAEYLARFAEKVYCYCLYPGNNLHGERVEVCSGIPLAVEGTDRVNRLITSEGAVPVSGVFLLKECAPPQALVGGLHTDGTHVSVNRDLSTNLPGLFAAGDVTGRPYQYAKAAGEGCVAAHSARAFLRQTHEKSD